MTPDPVFEAAADLLAREIGLRLDGSGRTRLRRCLREVADEHGWPIEDVVVEVMADRAALQSLLDRVTVQETSFFRDAAQFEAFASHVLPQLDGPVTVWSAGCANGQEPYSLAMVLAEARIERWQVVATDVSTRATGRTEQGRYGARELRGLSDGRRRRYLRAAGDGWEIVPELRERVTVLRHNLVTDRPPVLPGACQVVFCRNVLIYFRPDEIESLVDRFEQVLPPGGWLFLGFSESLWQVNDRFELLRIGDAYLYRRPAGTARPARPARRRQVAHLPAPPPASRPAATGPRSSELPDVGELIARGEELAARGEVAEAIPVLRQACYLDPEHPIAHFVLGLALETAGDPGAARRAFTAARNVLDEGDHGRVQQDLGGYQPAELARLLDSKLEVRQ